MNYVFQLDSVDVVELISSNDFHRGHQADGFYEWRKIGPKKKQAHNTGMKDDGLFAFAGLWDRFRLEEESGIRLQR
jgi:hypothetical protein